MTNADDPIPIDLDGDVCFVLADGRTVRVSSILLSWASPVLVAMLGGRFKEGQSERSACHPQRINLSGDDPEAMVSLCNIIHFRAKSTDILTSPPSPQLGRQLLNLAIVMDKYRCLDSLGLASDAIFQRFVRSGPEVRQSLECTANLVAAAYLLREQFYFTLFTRWLVLDHCNSYPDILEYACGATIPTFALCKFVSIKICLLLLTSI